MKSRIEIIMDIFECDEDEAKKLSRFQPTLVEELYTLRLAFIDLGEAVSKEFYKAWYWNLRTKL